MLCDLLLKFTACCPVAAVTALQWNAGHALVVYQVLTRFKNTGEHKHDNFNRCCNSLISSMHRLDDSSRTTTLLPVVMIPRSQMLTWSNGGKSGPQSDLKLSSLWPAYGWKDFCPPSLLNIITNSFSGSVSSILSTLGTCVHACWPHLFVTFCNSFFLFTSLG